MSLREEDLVKSIGLPGSIVVPVFVVGAVVVDVADDTAGAHRPVPLRHPMKSPD
jgi:hypothetical protein